MKKVEAISICVNYSKYFKFCIPRNQKHFSRWIVVTTSNDEETIELCKKHNLELVMYDGFTDEQCLFQKSKGINMALQKIEFKGANVNDMVLCIDSDIILPDYFTKEINGTQIKVNGRKVDFCHYSVYGANKCDLKGDIFDGKVNELFKAIDNYGLRGFGSSDIRGYFQLFSKNAINDVKLTNKKMIYPEISSGVGFDDRLFSKFFYKSYGMDMTCIHIGENK